MTSLNFKLVNVGFCNMVPATKITAIVDSDSLPIKRSISEARERNTIIDATQGRKTRAAVFLDNGYIVLSAIETEIISSRFAATPCSNLQQEA